MQGHKPWSKKPKGNLVLAQTKNPLRHYIQKTIREMDLSGYPQRPPQPINLSIGDPTASPAFRTHPDNLQTLARNVGKVDGYTSSQGLEDARAALAQTFKVPSYLTTESDVWLTAGGSFALWASILLLAQKGDNFLFPSPGFPLSLTIAHSMQIQVRFYKLKENCGWEADPVQIQTLIDEKTKFLYVNDPSNPLGSCWSEAHKRTILEICERRKLPLVSDDIYEDVVYEHPIPKSFTQCSNGSCTIFKCSGLTKRWFGPGWRLGWLIVYGPQEQKKYYNARLKGIFNIILMPHTVLQCSVREIITNQNNQKHLLQKMELMKVNKVYLQEKLQGKKYCKFGAASGAFYITIILDLMQLKLPSAKEFCLLFYAEENVMVFPGDFFVGQVPFIRAVISHNLNILQQFFKRFERFCERRVQISKE